MNELVFISGKGGVGKTTLSLFLAHSLSLKSKKVLFVELTPRSSAQALLQTPNKPIYKPTGSGFGFDWCLLSGVECLVEYVGSLIKVEKIAQNFFENPMVNSLLNVAPGLNDLAILGKLTSSIRGHGPGFQYDHIIVDALSTGHFSSMLLAPKHLGASVSMGPLKSQSESIEKVLLDANTTEYFFVSLYEKLPFTELTETLTFFEESQLRKISVVMNKYIQLTKGEIEDPNWKEYLSKRLNQQKNITEYLEKLVYPIYNCPLLVDDLQTLLKKSKGVNLELL